MTLWKISAKNKWEQKFKVLCLFTLSQLVMLLVLNLIPLGNCEWASVCREWIEKTILN